MVMKTASKPIQGVPNADFHGDFPDKAPDREAAGKISARIHFPKLTARRILFAMVGMGLGLTVPIGTFLFRLFVFYRAGQTPIDWFFYEIQAYSSFYVGMAIAGASIFAAFGFYIGAAKGWLSQQNETLLKTHHFYKTSTGSKLESVSLLAAGIGHDFNNLLSRSVGNLGLAKMAVDREEEIYEQLTAAESALISAKTLTRQLFTFAKDEPPAKAATSIAQLIRDMAEFTVVGSNIRCDVSIPSDLSPVDINEERVRQVIHNFMVNARDAMPGGGAIHVRAENKRLRPEDGMALAAGHYVKLTISDHGDGFSKDQLNNLFKLSSKTKEEGGRLDLILAHSIVTRNNGAVSVKSTVRVGTSFDIFLPASEEASA